MLIWLSVMGFLPAPGTLLGQDALLAAGFFSQGPTGHLAHLAEGALAEVPPPAIASDDQVREKILARVPRVMVYPPPPTGASRTPELRHLVATLKAYTSRRIPISVSSLLL